MLASELAAHPGLRVADPARVRRELEGEHVRPDGRIDAATAGQVGKAVGVRYSVHGIVRVFYGSARGASAGALIPKGTVVRVLAEKTFTTETRSARSFFSARNPTAIGKALRHVNLRSGKAAAPGQLRCEPAVRARSPARSPGRT